MAKKKKTNGAVRAARLMTSVDRNGHVRIDAERAALWLAERGVKRTPTEIADQMSRAPPGARSLASYLTNPFTQLELPL